MNSFTDKEKLELFAQQIHDSGVDITSDYNDWIKIAFACASQDESGREPFHLISSNYANYSREECDEKYSNCLRTKKNRVTLGTLVMIAKDFGIELKLPLGRRPKTQEQKEEEQATSLETAERLLKGWAMWWHNTWNDRIELQEPGGERRPIRDRDVSTFYCRLKKNGVRISAKDVEHLIQSRDFAVDNNPFQDYFDSLPGWTEGDTDYIREFFVGHMEFGDPESTELYDLMLHKWFVGMVALWMGKVDENPIMPVFYGSQHIGKTYFVRHILPPPLQNYLFQVNPLSKVDKDFEISMSETPIMFLDELNINNMQKSEAYKYATTSSASYLRESYGHFREKRERKASLIAATNHEKFIRGTEGTRRYLAIHLVNTTNLKEHPLPYEGAYAQALYLLEHGYETKPTKEESQKISEHAKSFVMNDDVVEALNTFVRQPSENEEPIALSAGELLQKLGEKGFRGSAFNTVNIGKAMKAMGFKPIKRHGLNKYRVVLADALRLLHEQTEDAKDTEENAVETSNQNSAPEAQVEAANSQGATVQNAQVDAANSQGAISPSSQGGEFDLWDYVSRKTDPTLPF